MNKPLKEWEGRIAPLISFDNWLYLFTFLCPVFFLQPWEYNMAQRIFFVFGVFTLLIVSFFSQKKLEYNNKYLGCLMFLSLLSVFMHSYKASFSGSYIAQWANFALLSEGFIYILCGCLLYRLIIEYKNKFNIAYPILAINSINFIFCLLQLCGVYLIWKNNGTIYGVLGHQSQMAVFSALSIPILASVNLFSCILPFVTLLLSKSYTALFAFIIASAYYLYKKDDQKIKVRFLVWTIIWLPFIILKFNFITSKLHTRVYGIVYTIGEIIQRPFGWGFDNSLRMNMISSPIGMIYRHNDFLNLARDLGIPFLIIGLLFLWNSLRKTNMDFILVSLLIIIISCMFQTNFYYPRVAAFGIILLALKVRNVLSSTG